MIDRPAFAELAARRTARAIAADIRPLGTIEDRSAAFPGLDPIGSDWSRRYYDGPFHLFPLPAATPAVSLVFVRSREGNTAAHQPADLGGGPTDVHLIYEGLSRVAADGVLTGASTAASPTAFFSIWHPELVDLRARLGLPRHPAQIVITGRAAFQLETALLASVPDVPAIVLTRPEQQWRLAQQVRDRPWVSVLAIEPDLATTLQRLRADHGIRRISAIGGRTTATALVDAGLVQDVHLTTTGRSAGEPGTPFYGGSRSLVLNPIVRKEGMGDDAPILYEHFGLADR